MPSFERRKRSDQPRQNALYRCDQVAVTSGADSLVAVKSTQATDGFMWLFGRRQQQAEQADLSRRRAVSIDWVLMLDCGRPVMRPRSPMEFAHWVARVYWARGLPLWVVPSNPSSIAVAKARRPRRPMDC